MVHLWLVRHGETNWNVEGRVQGWTDIPLNAVGVLQAKQLAVALQDTPFDAVFTSDLERARVTAELIAASRPQSIIVDSVLRERSFGDEEGRKRGESARHSLSSVNTAPAESDEVLCTRVKRFLDRVSATFHGGNILAVSHGGWIRMALHAIGCAPPDALHNTGITRLVYTRTGWKAQDVDWHEHLENPTAAFPDTRCLSQEQ